jgi:hypothetical protein
METITAFLLGLPFIFGLIIFVALAIIMGVLIETERTGWVGTITTALIIFFVYSFKDPILNFISFNPLTFTGYVVGYLAIGIAWSIIKWRVYVSDKMKTFKALRDKYTQINGTPDSNWKRYIEFLNSYKNSITFNDSDYFTFDPTDTKEDVVGKILPQPALHKALIISWISHWVISVVATFLNNPFRRFFEFLFDRLSGIFNGITVSIGKKYVD